MTRMPRSAARRPRAGDVHRLAVEANLAGVPAIGAAENLHQRGLAGAVLAEEHVDVAGAPASGRHCPARRRQETSCGCRASRARAGQSPLFNETGTSNGLPPARITLAALPTFREQQPRLVMLVEHEHLVDPRQSHGIRGGGCSPAPAAARTPARECRMSRRGFPPAAAATRKQPSRTMRYRGRPRSTGSSHVGCTGGATADGNASAALPTSPQASTKTNAAGRESCWLPGGASSAILPSRRISIAGDRVSPRVRIHHRFARHVGQVELRPAPARSGFGRPGLADHVVVGRYPQQRVAALVPALERRHLVPRPLELLGEILPLPSTSTP